MTTSTKKYIDSRELSDLISQSHSQVVKRILRLEDYYGEDNHSNKWHRSNESFEINHDGAIILIGDNFRDSSLSELLDILDERKIYSTKKRDFINNLSRILNGAKLKFETNKKCIDGYVDFYIPSINLSINFIDLAQKYKRDNMNVDDLNSTHITVDYTRSSFANIGTIINHILSVNGII